MVKSNNIKVTASFDEDYLCETPEAEGFTEMLRQYKEVSFATTEQNIITPNENIQRRVPGIHPLFGRDKIFERPDDLVTDINYENLTHAHLVDPDAPDAFTTAQWYRTSNTALIYAGFHVNKDHFHLYVLDLLNDPDEDAHDKYTREEIEVYLEYAAHYRRTFKL